MRLFCGWVAAAMLLGPRPVRADDLASGPEKGVKTAALKVYDATGDHKEKTVDYAAKRKEKVTIYILLRADKFDRPMNRFMKGVDSAVNKDFAHAYVVAVWLTDDEKKTKERLPVIQDSVKYEKTALTCFKGMDGPKGWGINPDAHLTVVLTNKGKVVKTWAYQSVNETAVAGITKALKKIKPAKK
jgi:hypothetical protein